MMVAQGTDSYQERMMWCCHKELVSFAYKFLDFLSPKKRLARRPQAGWQVFCLKDKKA